MFQTKRKALVLALSMALSGSLLMGCSGKEERQQKYLQRAQEYLAKGNYDKARIETKNVLQINDKNAEAHFLVAELAEHDANWRQMYSALNSALENDPNLVKARLKLAQLLIAFGDVEKAGEQAEKIRAQTPESADYYALTAAIALRKKSPDEAITNAEKALSVEPGHIGATTILASIYAGTDPEKAEQILIAGIKKSPDENTLRLLLIEVYARQNKADDAVKGLQELIKRNPDETKYVAQLAGYLIKQGRNGEADKLLQDTVAAQPKNTDIKIAYLEFFSKQHKPEETIALATKYSSAEPDNYKLRSVLARLYQATNASDKAISTYQYTIDKDVKSEGIDARNRVIEILLAQNKRAEAEVLLQDVLKLESENADALLMRARLALIDNKPDAAIADLRSILKNSPDSSQALLLLAAAQERTGAANLALDNYNKVLDINPKDVAALLGAARLELADNRLDKAQKLLEAARALAGTNVDVTRLLVELYVRKQQWQPAIELCEQLTLNSDSAALGYYMKGRVLFVKKSLPEAIESFKRSLDKAPSAIEPLQALVEAYAATKQLDVAVSYLEGRLKAYPDQVHAQELLGALYRQTGKLPLAQSLLDQVIQKQPSRISAYRELMAVYAAQHQQDKIAALLEKGVQQNPQNINLLLLQADFLQSVEQDQKALDAYEKALAVQPKSDIVKNNLAVLLINKFPTDTNLRRAHDLAAGFADSRNPVLVDTLAWVQYKMQNYPQAISLLESVLTNNIDAPELRYHLGMAYLKNGAADKAKIELAKATAGTTQYSGRAEAEAELRKL